jgi:hypothetical protein
LQRETPALAKLHKPTEPLRILPAGLVHVQMQAALRAAQRRREQLAAVVSIATASKSGMAKSSPP